MLLLLVILLVALALAGTPTLGWQPYGWVPSTVLWVVAVVLIVLLLFGRV